MNSPKLRFNFNDSWEKLQLGSVLVERSTISKNTEPSYSLTLENGVTKKTGRYERSFLVDNESSAYKVVKSGDFVYNPMNLRFGAIAKHKENFDVRVSKYYNIFSTNDLVDSSFCEQYLRSPKMIAYYDKMSTGSLIEKRRVHFSDFVNFKIPFPSKQEQEKISRFLSKIDNQISQLASEIILLNSYKKGVSEKIFNQEIAFKDIKGMDFPKWEVKTLKELGETFNGLTGKSGDDFGAGKPYISYKQIFESTTIDTSKCSFVSIKPNEKQSRVQYGDAFFTTSSETPAEVGYCSILLEKVDELYLNSFCFGFRFNSFKTLLPEFAKFLFFSNEFRKQVTLLAQGSTRYNISKSGFLKISLKLPCLEEQIKIANFLSAIDEKISNVQQKLELTKQYKQGLLQQMFV